MKVFSLRHEVFIAWKLFKVLKRIWGKEGIHQQQSQHPLSHVTSVMSSLVWLQAAAVSDDLEERVFLNVARDLQSQSLLHHGRQMKSEQGGQRQLTWLVKGVISLYPDRVMGAAVVTGTRINQPSPLDKSVVIKPKVKPGSLVSTSESGFALLVVTRDSQEARGCQPHPKPW